MSSTKLNTKDMQIDHATHYKQRLIAAIGDIQNHLLDVLASGYVTENKKGTFLISSERTVVLEKEEFSKFRDEIYKDSDGWQREPWFDSFESQMRLDWIGGNKFIYWNTKAYLEQADIGVTTDTYEVPTPVGVMSISDYKCTGFLEVADGRTVNMFANPKREYSCVFNSGNYQSGNEWIYEKDNLLAPKTGIFSFIADSKFNIGQFIRTHNWNIPDSKKSRVCPNADKTSPVYEKDCVAEMSARSEKVTKKIEGEWIVSHHKLNLKEICQYAEPNSDFISD